MNFFDNLFLMLSFFRVISISIVLLVFFFSVFLNLYFIFIDYIYIGTVDGKILYIYKGEISVLVKFGKGLCGNRLDYYFFINYFIEFLIGML